MSIQFPCPSCGQPIEVDDEFAGQNAACPYCRRVVGVPAETADDIRPAAVARPTLSSAPGEPGAEPRETPAPPELPPTAPPPPGGLHVGPLPANRDRAASTYGTYAMICTILVVLLFGTLMVYGVVLTLGELRAITTTQPTTEEMGKAQAAAMEQLFNSPWIAGLSLGAEFFAVVGLVLGIVSLRAGNRPNWKAVVALVICGMLALCTCGSLLSSLSGVATPAAATLLS